MIGFFWAGPLDVSDTVCLSSKLNSVVLYIRLGFGLFKPKNITPKTSFTIPYYFFISLGLIVISAKSAFPVPEFALFGITCVILFFF